MIVIYLWLTIILLYCLSGSPFRQHVRRNVIKSKFFPTSIPLFASDTPSQLWETVKEPTVYVEDLYGALGVLSNATTAEIKEAYKALVFQNHPDRNDSIIALYTFRNASHAYQILGRDRKLRNEYDSRYLSRMYLSVLEDVGTEVLRPLAMDVAVPLINFTAQALGSFLKPMFESSMSATSAVFEVWSASDVGEETGMGKQSTDSLTPILNRLQRMGNVIETKNYESRREKMIDQTASTSERLQASAMELEKAREVEQALRASVDDLVKLQPVLQIRRDECKEVELRAKIEFDAYLTEEKRLLEQYQMGVQFATSTLSEQQMVAAEVQRAAADVARLEMELANAISRAQILKEQDLSMQQSLEELRRTSEQLKVQSNAATESRIVSEALYVQEERRRIESEKELSIVTDDLGKQRADSMRQKDACEAIVRRIAQLTKKERALLEVLSRTEKERQNAVEQRKQREDAERRAKETEAVAALQRAAEDRRLQLEAIDKAKQKLMAQANQDDEKIRSILSRRSKGDLDD